MAENSTESKEKPIHDGVSPIYIPEGDEEEAFQALWEYLIPPYGKAQTAQGEIIRIAGRVQHEFLDNGCINWDGDFQKMLDAFLGYLQLGNGFSRKDLESAEVLVRLLKENGEKGFIDGRLTTVLCSCAMAWVRQNPEVITPLEAEYRR
ncbi:hypothetical protein D3Z51_19615 [Clostridiaceae bacterium]|nr:hypothetical protein [Clostridiaceae bacterium]RKI07885.1 hypothetical protein D7V81_19655 [bacterium 1XD21-70]